MPNHCENKLTVYGPEDKVADFVEKARGQKAWATPGDAEQDISFHALFPVPSNVIQAGFSDAGYYWCSNHWGTKWGAYDLTDTEKGDGWVTYGFTTAWAPPTPFLAKVSEDFPELTFALSFSEENPTRGRHLIQNGELKAQVNESCPLTWDEDADEEEESERFEAWQNEFYDRHEEWVFGNMTVDSRVMKYYGRFSDPEVHLE